MIHQDRLGNAIDPRTGKPAGGKVHGQPNGFSVSQGQFCIKTRKKCPFCGYPEGYWSDKISIHCKHQPLCNAWRGSLGLEPTPELYIQHIVQVFREIRRVLRKDGCVFLNLGDSYHGGGGGNYGSGLSVASDHGQHLTNVRNRIQLPGLKPKDLCGIPWRVFFALQADGWWGRSGLPWVKRSAMPESVTDRPASALEYVFLLTKSEKYFFDMEAVRVKSIYPDDDRKARSKPDQKRMPTEKIAGVRPGSATYPKRNFRNTDLFYQSIESPHGLIFAGDEPVGLDVNPQSFSGAHFATFAEALVSPLIKAGTSEKGCCPECGAPWVRVVEKTGTATRPGRESKYVDENGNDLRGDNSGHLKQRVIVESKTIGWKPSCVCGTEHPIPQKDLDADPTLLDDFEIEPYPPIPCTVLDCFGGSGRTAIVAKKLGRKCIIIELKPEYCSMPLDELRQENIF